MSLIALLIAWVAVCGLRILAGGNAATFDEVPLWTLRILTVVIVMQVVISLVRFVRGSVKAARQGDQVLTETSVRTILLGVLLAGLICRVSIWGTGRQGVVGWAGVVMIGIGIVGLGVLNLRQAHREGKAIWSYWSPYVRAALAFLCLASLIVLGAAKPTGVLDGVLAAIFWLTLLALLIQIVGGRFRRPSHHLGK